MTYRKAKSTEADAIAHLHAQSWQVAYKGILTDAFLENDVLDNRLQKWRDRFNSSEPNRIIFVAVENNQLKGFICLYGKGDVQWGTLVDNLHVLPALKGQGIGKRLMQKGAEWVAKNYPDSGLYLWVYEDNHAAKAFYEKLGGENVESHIHENPDGGSANTFRYAWKSVAATLVAERIFSD